MSDDSIRPYICPECGRHTAIRSGIVLRHSDYRLLPMKVYPCPQSEQPFAFQGGSRATERRISLASLAVQPRDEVIAQVMAFLLERGYAIVAPDGRPVTPPGGDAE